MSLGNSLEVVSQKANSLSDNIFRIYYKFNIYRSTNLAEARQYEPLRLQWISPTSLTRELPGPTFRMRHTPGIVVGGDWDLNTIDYHRCAHFIGFQQHFIEGRPWIDTVLYCDAINRPPGKLWHGCKTKHEVIKRLQQYELVFESISRNGYKTQRELVGNTNTAWHKDIRLRPPELDEIIVHIDRNGNYIFDDGRHRLAIAKILNLSKIPVLVIARHKQWYANSNIRSY